MMIGRVIAILTAILTALTVGLQAYNVYRRRGPVPVATVLARSAKPSVTTLHLDRLPIKGESAAKVAIVEFSDYECPFCAMHATTVGPVLEREFIRTGTIRYAFSNYPLPIHSRARSLAAAALCAGEQNRYWEMHDALFRDKPSTDDQVVGVATSIGADAAAFEKCVKENPAPTQTVDVDVSTARALGVSVTPSFVVGRVTEQGQLTVVTVLSGAQTIDAFRKAINDVLARPGGR